MAKGNLLLGMGRGKLGDVVLYRQNGQQMSRPRVRVVKNPRTSGQQIQRMIQATIAYGYAGLKTIVDHSFEGVQYGGKSMNYFMKRNMDALRAQVIAGGNGENIKARFAIPNVRVIYPNEYIVSNGSLPPCPAPTGSAATMANGLGLLFTAGSAQSVTLESFMNFFGADAGDQLTFLIFNAKSTENGTVASIGDEAAYAMALAIRRIKFKDSYTESELASDVTATEGLFDMSVTSSDLVIGKNGSGSVANLIVTVPTLTSTDNVLIAGGCVIRSRKQGENWLRSPQTVVILDQFLTPTGDSRKAPGFLLSTAYNAWMAGTTPVGVSEYILNGKPNTDTWPEVDDENP